MIVSKFKEALKKKASVVTGAAVAMMISGVMLNSSGDSNIMISNAYSNAYDIPGVEWNIDDNGTLYADGIEPDTQIIASRYDVYVSVYLYDITPEGQLIPVSGSYPNFSTAPWYEYKIAEDRDIAALQPYQYPVMKYDFNSAVIGNNISYISDYALYNTGHNKRGHELKQEVDPTVAVLLDSVTILNPECEIESKDAIYAKKICGYEGSTAQTFAEDNGYEFVSLGEPPELTINKSENHYIISGCDKSAVSVQIPSDIDGVPVTEIAENAFQDCSLLESVTIPESITKIGDRAFSGCSSLNSITIPDSVSSVGGGLFYNCTNLQECNLPAQISWLNSYIDNSKKYNEYYGFFEKCKSLKEINLPDSLTYIGIKVFSGCSSLESVIIPGKITTIERLSFAGCDSLKDVIIPKNVTKIDNMAFAECEQLENITILNPECEIKEDFVERTIYNRHETWSDGIYATDVYFYYGTITGYDGSTAEEYADSHDFNGGYTFVSLGEAPVNEPALIGDADLDGKVGISDVVKVMMYVSNKEANFLDEQQLLNADVYNSGDGVFISDALSIQKKVAQIIDTLPEA
ncbi:MAG: leucine-rich repeat protein [Oscillospiraceae bacterium]|nr:leucine-rich repeat protein [Oscillospiraceae bacterium]